MIFCIFTLVNLARILATVSDENAIPTNLGVPLHRDPETSPITVYVVLDAKSREDLASDSSETNKHSLRSLWDKDVDYWDINTNHSCSLDCRFHTNYNAMKKADGILFSAQLFPSFNMFFDVIQKVSSPIVCSAQLHTKLKRFQRQAWQSTILWSTEAVSNFRLGPQLPILENIVDITGANSRCHA